MADTYELLTRYAWHLPDDVLADGRGCSRWFDPVPNTDAKWGRVPRKCDCGFYQALHEARTNA